MATTEFRVWRGDSSGGELKSYQVDVGPGYVVLDAIHQIQAEQENDLAVRWNCKAGKCGSCSAEVNGTPRLMCMTRVDDLPKGEPITIEPMRTFPSVKDLVTDVSWNYEVKKSIPRFQPGAPDRADGTWTMDQYDVERPQEFRKCIECFLCQDVCHVLRDHHMHAEFAGPRHYVYVANMEMNPIDTGDRVASRPDEQGHGDSNNTKCCTKGCPAPKTLTHHPIKPLKQRGVDSAYHPHAKRNGMIRG
jgi:succinate dehydrogenase / fumarate reductase iron-sulfur subunit